MLLLHRRSLGGRSGRLGCALVVLTARVVAGVTERKRQIGTTPACAGVAAGVVPTSQISGLRVVFAASGLPRGPGCGTLILPGLGFRYFVLCAFQVARLPPFPLVGQFRCWFDSARCLAGVDVRRCPSTHGNSSIAWQHGVHGTWHGGFSVAA